VQDVSALPEFGFSAVSPMWWGTLGFVAIETTGFALGIGTYFYLAYLGQEWPLSASPPRLGPGTWLLLVLLLSLWPNYLINRWAEQQNMRKVRWGLILMSIFGLLPLLIRIFEFQALEIRWDTNAYGSIVWVLLGLHTVHLLTDVADTWVLAVLMFTRHARPKRFSDVSDNAFYWYFVVVSWVLLYGVIYWAPRL
jgi:heme/copper-type cytochrome/quinol oxidase subunit 3